MKNAETIYTETVKEAQKLNDEETAFVTNPVTKDEAKALAQYLKETMFLRSTVFEENGFTYVSWDLENEVDDDGN
jgi:hypothetical protein